MRISDWSSDVCSSDLCDQAARDQFDRSRRVQHRIERHREIGREIEEFLYPVREEQKARDDAQQRVGLFAETIEKFHDRPLHVAIDKGDAIGFLPRSEEHTSELQSLMRISNAVL